MQLLAETSGYSYREWLGHFYPEKLPASAMLRYYAERFAAVEINNTFYRMPESDLRGWVEPIAARSAWAVSTCSSCTRTRRSERASRSSPTSYGARTAGDVDFGSGRTTMGTSRR